MANRHSRAALAEVRARRALHLYVTGMSYAEVAAALLPCPDHRPHGDPECDLCIPMYSNKSAAYKAVQRALLEDHSVAADDREHARRVMLAQLREAITAAMAEALAPRADETNRLEAMRTLVRLWDRQSKLMGLDAPTRVVVTPDLDLELEAAAEQLYQEARARSEAGADTP